MLIITNTLLKELGFTLISRTNSTFSPYQVYGKAKDKTGMTLIHWNEEGASCTYSGDKLEPNNYLTIEKDGGTRTVFNGYVFNKEDVIHLLKLTL
jgi:hypothetical protein